MGHEKETTVRREGSSVFKLHTMRYRDGVIRAKITEWQDDGSGFQTWNIFGAWSCIAAEMASRATLAAVEKVHAAGLPAAPAILDRLAENRAERAS